jgi:hypothetical protein
MKIKATILSLFVILIIQPVVLFGQDKASVIGFDFYGDPVEFEFDQNSRVGFDNQLTGESIQNFYKTILNSKYQPIINALLAYKEQHKPDDWLYYQLIRKTAQQISPKAENYQRYTLYKWFLLSKSGYDATLAIAGDQILFYVQSDENIYNIPYRIRNGKQYVCLNYHDYGAIDFEKTKFSEIAIHTPEAQKPLK